MTERGHSPTNTTTAWIFRSDVELTGSAIIDYDVEASDGSIGKVTEESVQVGSAYIVVDTGFWIFDKLRLIPAGAITRIDHTNETIHLSLSKAQIKDAPDYVPESALRDPHHADHYSALERYFIPWV